MRARTGGRRAVSVARGINPLRISLDRIWIYGASCALVVSLPFLALRWFPKVAYLYDFACFWSAGATAGTRTLTDPDALNAWAHRHGMIAQPFSYLPGFAWAYWPLSRVGPIAGLALEEALMAALFVAAALIAARVYGYNRWFCVAATLGWAPAINSIEVGQNAGLALLLVLAATCALREKRDAAAGFAWAYAPLSRVNPLAGLAIEEALMAALFVAAALIAARIYGYNRWFCIAATLAWAPAINSIEVGQNAGLALVLVLATTWALREKRDAAAGLAAGLLLYKPTVALPMLLLLVVRRQWRALGVSTACAAGWYFVSVAASGGDWRWPAAYAHTMAWWLPMDFLAGSVKAFSLPTLLMAAGASLATASVVAAAIWLVALPVATRSPLLEAASMMPLVGLAASVHAWPYEAALALPAIFYAMGALREPPRTALLAAAYAATAILMVTRYGTAALFVTCVGGSAWWLWAGYRRGIMPSWSVPPTS